MRILLFLSALLAALTGATGSARAVIGVESSATLTAGQTPTIAVSAGTGQAAMRHRVWPLPATTAAALPRWAIDPAAPRWIERLRV